jgi:putative ABC transport system substrate-binding protein
MLVVGFLGASSPHPSARGPFAASLRQRLAEAGFVEGRNLAIESRSAYGDSDKLSTLADELSAIRSTLSLPLVETLPRLPPKRRANI